MRTLWQDTRYTVRTLGRSRGFTVMAVGILAIGVGGSMMIFTIVGVLPASAIFPAKADLLVPLAADPAARTQQEAAERKQSGFKLA